MLDGVSYNMVELYALLGSLAAGFTTNYLCIIYIIYPVVSTCLDYFPPNPMFAHAKVISPDNILVTRG